jgi:hypothetical protein
MQRPSRGVGAQRAECARLLVRLRQQLGQARSSATAAKTLQPADTFQSHQDLVWMNDSLQPDVLSTFERGRIEKHLSELVASRGAFPAEAKQPFDWAAFAMHGFFGAASGALLVLSATWHFWDRHHPQDGAASTQAVVLAGAIMGGILAGLGRDMYWAQPSRWYRYLYRGRHYRWRFWGAPRKRPPGSGSESRTAGEGTDGFTPRWIPAVQPSARAPTSALPRPAPRICRRGSAQCSRTLPVAASRSRHAAGPSACGAAC